MQRKGNITVFAAMCIMLVASVLFTLLEAARIRQMELLGSVVTESVLESVFAGYDLPLWEKYHMLLRSASTVQGKISLGDLEQEMEVLADAAMNPDSNILSLNAADLLRAKTDSVKVTGYSLITDEEGKVFENAVAAYMKKNLGYEAAEQLRNKYEQGKEMEETDADEAIANAKKEIDTAEMEVKEKGDQGAIAPRLLSENPIITVIRLKKMGILTLLLEEPSQVSQGKINLQDSLSRRTLNKGTQTVNQKMGWYEEILIHQYYALNYANYLSPNTEGALQYEQEYLICGKSNDVENLKGCVNRILLIRETGNLLYLLQDAQKQSEALALATVLAGASANPAVIEAVQYGILAAWAYVESILDLRALLQGEQIPLIKTVQQWTSDLDGLSKSASSFRKADSCNNGFTYQEYLNLLFYISLDSSMAYRAMDIQEWYLKSLEGYENFSMDQMIAAMSVTADYKFSENYLSFLHFGNFGNTMFIINSDSSYSYLKAGA